MNSVGRLLRRLGGASDFAMVVPFTVAAVAGASADTALPTRLPAARLTQGFAVLLVGIGDYVATQPIPRLVV